VQRRRLLAALSGVVGATSGCLARLGGDGEAAPGTAASPADGAVTGADGQPSNICERDAFPQRIAAIVEPSFAPSWREGPTDLVLDDGTAVVGVERGGTARAYPVTVLRSHEIVNDDFDVPVLVTYCPICASGMTAVRQVDGERTVFDNTSHTWTPPGGAGEQALEEGRVYGFGSSRNPENIEPRNDPNLVMFDRATGSYWSQLLAGAICGPRTGERLELLPSTVTTWGEWRAEKPDTEVLLPPPHSATTEA